MTSDKLTSVLTVMGVVNGTSVMSVTSVMTVTSIVTVMSVVTVTSVVTMTVKNGINNKILFLIANLTLHHKSLRSIIPCHQYD